MKRICKWKDNSNATVLTGSTYYLNTSNGNDSNNGYHLQMGDAQRENCKSGCILALMEVDIECRVHVGKGIIAGNIRTEFNLPGKGEFDIDCIGRRAQKYKHTDNDDLFHSFIPIDLNNVSQCGIRVKQK